MFILEKNSLRKKKQYQNETYWGKPVPGFGDEKAEILILGLAPAAHGGNRTGRPFTGDKSAEFLFKCLFNSNLANQPYSRYIGDGLKLKNIYITVALKCVPPFDKPNSEELKSCFNFLKKAFKSFGFELSKFNSPFVIPAIIANDPASILSGITEYVIGFNFKTPSISIIFVPKRLCRHCYYLMTSAILIC